MNHFLILSTILAIYTLLTEGLFLKRQSESQTGFLGNRTCKQNVEEDCLEPFLPKYAPNFASHEVAQSSLSNRTILDSFASDLNETVGCINAILEEENCTGVIENDWIAMRLLADFMDSSERLDIIQAAALTPCLINGTLTGTAGSGLFICYLTFLQHFETQQDTCGLAYDEMETCAVTTATTHCGVDTGALVQSVWDFVENPGVRDSILGIYELEELSAVFNICLSQVNVVQRFAERALDVQRQ